MGVLARLGLAQHEDSSPFERPMAARDSLLGRLGFRALPPNATTDACLAAAAAAAAGGGGGGGILCRVFGGEGVDLGAQRDAVSPSSRPRQQVPSLPLFRIDIRSCWIASIVIMEAGLVICCTNQQKTDGERKAR